MCIIMIGIRYIFAPLAREFEQKTMLRIYNIVESNSRVLVHVGVYKSVKPDLMYRDMI